MACSCDVISYNYRYLQSQLLLWPSFKLSAPSLASSPLLRDLVFTSHTHYGYAHVSHRVYPLQTSARTSAELTVISSTVNKGREEEEKGEKGKVSDPEEPVHLVQQSPTLEYVRWTEIPLFLVAFIPKVSC